MKDESLDLYTFPFKMSELYKRGTSPTGKFGFPVTTYHGNTPISHGWADSWEEYSIKTTKTLLKVEQFTQGPNEEILGLIEVFVAKGVPSILRPLW